MIPVTIHDPLARTRATAFLASLGRETHALGEQVLAAGGVKSMRCWAADESYEFRVRGTQSYSVYVDYDRRDGWDAECTCSWGAGCKHVSAALQALLRSGGVPLPQATDEQITIPFPGSYTGPRAGQTKPVAKTAAVSALTQRVNETLGRPLTRDEQAYLAEVGRVFGRARSQGQLYPYDLSGLGWRMADTSYGPMSLYPELPADDLLFWLHLVWALRARGLGIPAFLEPVSDTSVIEPRMRAWRRELEVQNWRQRLDRLAWSPAPAAPTAPRPEARIRVMITPKQPNIEWAPADTLRWVPVKASQLKQWRENPLSMPFQLDLLSQLLWQMIAEVPAYSYGNSVKLDYDEDHRGSRLSHILRQPALAPLVVTARAEPLARVETPLRWGLTEPGDASGDYVLRLLDAGGHPAPAPLAVFPGQPWLYLTENQLFTTVPYPNELLEPHQANAIPASALETEAGVKLLDSLGAPTPQRLKALIRIVPVTVEIVCATKPSYIGSNTEECAVEVRARSADKVVEQTYAGDGRWFDRRYAQATPRKGTGIVRYDDALQAMVPAVMAPLGLRWNNTLSSLSLRLTKHFPTTFAAWLKTVPPEIPVRLSGDLASFTEPDIAGSLSLTATEADLDWFDLRVSLQVADTSLTPEELKLLLDAQGSYVRLKGRGWRRLAFDLTPEQDEHLARLGLSPRQLSGEPQRFHALQLADPKSNSLLPEPQVQQIRRRVEELKTRVTPALPAGLQAELRPYQLEGFHFLAYLAANRFGGILADDMGLGKTVQTLAWLLSLHEGQGDSKAAPVPPALVVCPKSVTNNWLSEARRFAPTLRVRVWTGADLSTLPEATAEADLHVINYAQLRTLGESLSSVQWLLVILDEGQFIKNPSSQTAQAARALRATHRLVLTGTPIENRLLDLWSLITFAMPGVLGSRTQFASTYDSKEDPLARRRLSARVRPFLLRRTKHQVASELPPRTEEDLYCELEGDQKTLYQAELKQARQIMLGVHTQQDLNAQRFNFLTSLLRLRQVCCHPGLLLPKSKQPGAKLEALLDLIEPLMEEGHKVLIFSQFVGVIDRLRPVLDEREWKVFQLTGDTENRGDLVDAFQTHAGAAVFLISLKAGGFGLNLTAANYVILFDPWWNPAVENQAIDRTHRIGQSEHVIAYRLLIKDSIEEKIRVLQKQKAALAEDILGEERFAQSLTLDDLRFLFADVASAAAD